MCSRSKPRAWSKHFAEARSNRALRPGVLWTALALATGCGQIEVDSGREATDGAPGAAAQADGDDGGAQSTDAGAGGRNASSGGDASRATTQPDRCNQVEIAFTSEAPTVFLLVDRSSSMFDQGFWEPLKAGVLTVVEQLDSDVRFGFTTYTGQQGGVCPELTPTGALAEDNFAAIRAAYDALGAPNYKGETPTALALEQVAMQLAADAADGPKYIMLVTDGEPDFCDDANVTCARDAVVAAVQAAYGRGIGTFIFSLGGDVDRSHLEDVANAGTGQPVEDRQNAVAQQCGTQRASYSGTHGSAAYFEPNVDQQALVNALSTVIAGVRTCVFELQGRIEIDLLAADQGVVEIDGTRVPYGGPDGYRMNSATQLELVGASCERLRDPNSKRVLIDFPCEAVVGI